MGQTVSLALTGATGELGGRVAARLADRGIAQRLVVRDPARAPRLDGAEVVRAAYQDGAAMRAALAGITTLFLVSGHQGPERVPEHLSAVDAAVAAGVRRVVYLSFVGASADATFTYARDHHATEKAVRARGLAFTFLRPSLYLDRFPHWVSPDGVVAGPAGDGRLAWVSRDDLADVAAAVLSDAERGSAAHDGATYDLTGPAALNLDEAAEVVGEVTGMPVSYRRETLEEAYASRSGYGAEAWEVEGWVSSYAAVAAGELAVVTATVAELTGHPPEGLAAYLRTHPETWAHLRPTVG
jgi:uncharacterized protein YbjT (DUF2867 family)